MTDGDDEEASSDPTSLSVLDHDPAGGGRLERQSRALASRTPAARLLTVLPILLSIGAIAWFVVGVCA